MISFEGSPLLSSIQKQLADRRRRKGAFARLTEVLHQVVAAAVGQAAVLGIIVDGLRPVELTAFSTTVGCRLVAVVQLECPQSEMLSRLKQRKHREGDERLGLSEMDDVSRVSAFEERDAAEIDALRKVYQDTFLSLDATGSIEALVDKVLAFGIGVSEAKDWPSIDWPGIIGSVASKLDQQFHPDGKPRKPEIPGCVPKRP